MIILNQQTDLSSESIDRLSDRMTELFIKYGQKRQVALRSRLTVEELLLRVRDRFGEDQVCAVKIHRFLGNPSIEVKYAGESFDPTSAHREDGEAWSEQILENMGLAPVWNYARGTNSLILHPPANGTKSMVFLVASIGCAVVLGLLGSLLPETFRNQAADLVLTPVCWCLFTWLVFDKLLYITLPTGQLFQSLGL